MWCGVLERAQGEGKEDKGERREGKEEGKEVTTENTIRKERQRKLKIE